MRKWVNMRKLLLTSAGLNEKFKHLFFEQLGKQPNEVKILFVPTASTVNDEAREAISICLCELQNMGILFENILVYDLRYLPSKDYSRRCPADSRYIPRQYRPLEDYEMMEYDALVFSGGDAEVLLGEVNRTGFGRQVKYAVEQGVFYLGISAGSMIAAANIPGNLGYIENALYVHCENGTPCGPVPRAGEVFLTNSQAIWICGDSSQIIA